MAQPGHQGAKPIRTERNRRALRAGPEPPAAPRAPGLAVADADPKGCTLATGRDAGLISGLALPPWSLGLPARGNKLELTVPGRGGVLSPSWCSLAQPPFLIGPIRSPPYSALFFYTPFGVPSLVGLSAGRCLPCPHSRGLGDGTRAAEMTSEEPQPIDSFRPESGPSEWSSGGGGGGSSSGSGITAGRPGESRRVENRA